MTTEPALCVLSSPDKAGGRASFSVDTEAEALELARNMTYLGWRVIDIDGLVARRSKTISGWHVDMYRIASGPPWVRTPGAR